MTAQVTELDVRVNSGRDADAEEIAESTAMLREELLQLEVDSVDEAPAGEAPPGTRAAEAVALGGLIVTLVNSSGLLSAVVGTIQSWVSRLGRRRVRLELDGDVLDVTGVSSKEQHELITQWIARHGATEPR